jgi:hypothetical protein
MHNVIPTAPRRASWIAACAVIGLCGQLAAAQPMPLSEAEVYGFLMEMSMADKRCDADWLERCHLPECTLTFQEVGKTEETIRPADYFKTYRKECYHTSRTLPRNKLSVRIEPYRAVVRGRWEEPSLVRYFFLDPVAFKWIEESVTLVRAGDAIGVASVHQTYELKPAESSSQKYPEPPAVKKLREFFHDR